LLRCADADDTMQEPLEVQPAATLRRRCCRDARLGRMRWRLVGQALRRPADRQLHAREPHELKWLRLRHARCGGRLHAAHPVRLRSSDGQGPTLGLPASSYTLTTEKAQTDVSAATDQHAACTYHFSGHPGASGNSPWTS